MSVHSGYGTFTQTPAAQSTKLSDGTIQHSADTINKLNKLLIRLKANQLINAKANEYYTRCNSKMVYPAIFISAVSSIASFMTTSSEINDNMKSAFGISVGIITTISTMMQAISSAAGYGTKAAAFLDAADSYSKLITNVQFEIDMPDENKLEFFNKMEDAILKINEKRKILPPLFIATPILDKYHEDIQKMDLTSQNTVSDSTNSLSFVNSNIPMMRRISNGIKNIFSSNITANSTPITTLKEQELIERAKCLEHTIIDFETQNKELRNDIERIMTDMQHLHRENQLYKSINEQSNNMISTIATSNKIMTDSLATVICNNLNNNLNNNNNREHVNSPVSTPVSFVRSLSPLQSNILKELQKNESVINRVEQVEINIPDLETDNEEPEIIETEKNIDNTLTTSSI